VGWDVIQEFLVAQTTQLAGVWQLSDVKDAYNACLSITLLPTILGNISGVSIEFSYKYIFPLIFAHFPVLVYFFFKKITNFSLSFLAVLYIMAQPFFIQPMVALARQEIAFFFFALLLVTLFYDARVPRHHPLYIRPDGDLVGSYGCSYDASRLIAPPSTQRYDEAVLARADEPPF
jgi:uncharacterized membrane protein